MSSYDFAWDEHGYCRFSDIRREDMCDACRDRRATRTRQNWHGQAVRFCADCAAVWDEEVRHDDPNA